MVPYTLSMGWMSRPIDPELLTEEELKMKATEKVTPRAWTLAKGAPYSELAHNRAHFSGWVIAAAQVAGMIRLNKLSVTSTKKAGDFELFKELVGKSAKRTWTQSGRVTKKGITAEGLNEMNARLAGENTYSTEMDIVRREAAAMRKGGALKLGETEYKLAVPIK